MAELPKNEIWILAFLTKVDFNHTNRGFEKLFHGH